MVKIKQLCKIFSIIFIILFFLVIETKANAKELNNYAIEGNIGYKIKENGNTSSSLVKKVLNNYPCTLIYSDIMGNKSKLEFETDENGDFHVDINIVSEINDIWVEIKSENDACCVKSSYELIRDNLPYKY